MSATAANAASAATGHPEGTELAPGYTAIALLHRGRSLEVWDAWSEERGCRCVVKRLRPDRAADSESRRALLREGELLRDLTHPHIVRAYEVIERPGPAIVIETLTGETLAHMIDRGVRLESSDLARLGLHLGAALRYLHAHGTLHLDLKPSNVIADCGRAKLIDLSIARPPGRAKAGRGTWCYLSPEQARGEELGPAADVWGIGVVLFEAATGQPAFDHPAGWLNGDSDSGWEYEGPYPQLEGRAPAVSALSTLSPAIADAIDGCLEPDPDARPALNELLATLEPLADLPPSERRWGTAA